MVGRKSVHHAFRSGKYVGDIYLRQRGFHLVITPTYTNLTCHLLFLKVWKVFSDSLGEPSY